MPADVVVTQDELTYRTILRRDLKEDRAAFLDTRIPGSEAKINYPLIGPGVSENAGQVIPVTEPHGFNLGGAVMPAGVVNNLHLHFTAEVFVCFAGEWRFRWGVDGADGEATVSDGDVISIPTWIFRGFTSRSDDAWLFTALGRDDSGGLIWAPSVLEQAARYGMHLSAANKIIETEPGQTPEGVELTEPLNADQLAALRRYSVAEMRERLATPADLVWHDEPFLDSTLPGGGAQLALVVGYGLTEDRFQRPRLSEPHGLALAWLRARPGRGVSTHRISQSQVLIVKTGRLKVTLNRQSPVCTELGAYDTLSVPPGAWRSFEAVGDEPVQVVVLTEGDGRVHIEWDPAVVADARAKDVALDPNGYLAPASLLPGELVAAPARKVVTMSLDEVAYRPYADPDDFIREVTDLIWVDREIGYITENYVADSVVHGGLGTSVGREQVIQGTLMRIADTPNRVGQAEDVVWEARGDDAFLSSHLVLSTDLENLDFRSRTIANCLYRRGRMVEEWVVRDSLAIARQLGQDPDELARTMGFLGFTGSMLDDPPADVLSCGVSGPRPDEYRGEVQRVLEFIDAVWNRRELKQVEDFWIRDLVLHTIDDRTIVRPEGYRRSLLRMLRPFPAATFDVLDVATNDSARYAGLRVAVTWRLRGRYDGAPDFGALTGTGVEVLGVSQFLLQSGRIVKETRCYDEIALRAQIAGARGDEPYLSRNIY